MKGLYIPHESVRSHTHWPHSNLSHYIVEGHGSCSLDSVRMYLETNELSSQVNPTFWNHSRCAFLAAVRWDYERQSMEQGIET